MKEFQLTYEDENGEKIRDSYWTRKGRCYKHSTLTGRTKRISEEEMMRAEDEYHDA